MNDSYYTDTHGLLRSLSEHITLLLCFIECAHFYFNKENEKWKIKGINILRCALQLCVLCCEFSRTTVVVITIIWASCFFLLSLILFVCVVFAGNFAVEFVLYTWIPLFLSFFSLCWKTNRKKKKYGKSRDSFVVEIFYGHQHAFRQNCEILIWLWDFFFFCHAKN